MRTRPSPGVGTMRRLAVVISALVLTGCGTQTTTVTVTTTSTAEATPTSAAAQPAPLPPTNGSVSLSDGQGTIITWGGPDAGQSAADFQANSANLGTYWTLYGGGPLPAVDDVCTMDDAGDHSDSVAVAYRTQPTLRPAITPAPTS